MILLFSAIAAVGLNTLVRSDQDLTEARNLAIVGLILALGIGGMTVTLGSISFSGIGLAGITGVLLNLLLPGHKETTNASWQQHARAANFSGCGRGKE